MRRGRDCEPWVGNTEIASPSSAAKWGHGLLLRSCTSRGGVTDSPSLAFQNGNSPVGFALTGNFVRELLEGKLTGARCEKIIYLFG